MLSRIPLNSLLGNEEAPRTLRLECKKNDDNNDLRSPNNVYTIFGSSGSNYTRVDFGSATSEAQHRMPNYRIHGTLGVIL
jgi:hypothetical protein